LRNGDPWYNPNLSQTRPDWSVDWERVATVPDPVPEGQGVNLVGYIRAEMGVGEATRGEAQALTDVGVPFVILDYSYRNPARMGDHTWLHKVSPRPVFDINVVSINADLIEEAIDRLPGLRQARYTIAIWAWELPEFPDRWLSSFTVVDEVWAPSEFVRAAIARKAPVPVVKIPHAVHIPTGPLLDRGHFGLPESPYQFLMMYDLNSVQERKNPRGALQAFVQAFPPDDQSAVMVIKVNNPDRRPLAEITDQIGQRSNVVLIDRVLDRREVDSLIASSDCFVSLHRSEGFGLPIAEAMAIGKPAIATNWSGNVDFMNAANSAPIDFRLLTLDRDFGPYAAGQQWADPDLEQASLWMRRLRDEPALGRELGAKAALAIEEGFGSLAVGREIAHRLDEIRASRS
jgi:glycosyltransferase involved in cell wall biosynthesis